jgi:hypothetical protein
VSTAGFIKLQRSEETEALFSDPNALHLVLVVAYRARYSHDANIHGLTFGQALIGDHKRYGLSRKAEACARQRLKKYGLVTFQAINGKGTVATLCNSKVFSLVDERQKKGHPKEQREGQPFSQAKDENKDRFGDSSTGSLGTAKGQLGDSNQNDQKGRNEDHTMIAAIFDAFPKRVGRKAAIKAINAALESITADRLLESTKAYAAAVASWPEDDRRFVPHPATWFNRGSYDDDPEQWKRTGAAGHLSPFAKAF